MASFTLEYEPLKRLPAQLRQFAAATPLALDRALYRWGQARRAALKGRGYPAAPAPKPGRKATRRTGQLANRWAARLEGRGLLAITNQAQARGRRYATYVIGDPETGHQAYMHRGRWWIARHEIEGRGWDELLERTEQELYDAWRRQGL